MEIIQDCNSAVVEIGIKCFTLLNITFCVVLFPSLLRSSMPRDGQLIFLLCFVAMDAHYCSMYCSESHLTVLYFLGI
jgi:hypothetical protein